ncbi:unnamed protein product [Moneuplotes crassus]|uniref:Uncharacterized protein n=1 Tax=Euplotes crassus TaxID=5936 RepID=A0AAD1UG45_EUPCR|nr:unnamed protein product [Moneuplotes crassus]
MPVSIYPVLNSNLLSLTVRGNISCLGMLISGTVTNQRIALTIKFSIGLKIPRLIGCLKISTWRASILTDCKSVIRLAILEPLPLTRSMSRLPASPNLADTPRFVCILTEDLMSKDPSVRVISVEPCSGPAKSPESYVLPSL